MYKSARPIANVIIALLALGAVLDLATGGWCVHGIGVMNGYVAGQAPMSAVEAYDATAATMAQAYLYFFVICTVLACLWLHRTAKNTAVLSDQLFQTTPGWAIGWYFVPYANLYKPQQIMREMFGYARPGAGGALISVWWGFWVIGGILGWVDMKLMMAVDSPDSFITSTTFSAVVSLINFGAAVAFMKVVADLTRFQDAAFTERIRQERAPVAAQPLAAPPAL